MIKNSGNRFCLVRCLAFSSLLFLSSGAFATPPSSQEAEFPNYFAELPPQVAQEKINKALDQTLRKLQVPYVDEDGNIKTDGFYLKLYEKISSEDPDAHAYISGGVVRSLLGYIYKKVYSAKKKDPHADVGQILDKIGTRDKDIPLLSAMGIGSDLDILLDTKKHSDDLKKRATQFINSAESKLELRGSTSKFKYALVPVGDVKDYHEQIGRTTAQGGSALDWLAFPLPQKGGKAGSIREPDGSYEIMGHFIKGKYDYFPPQDKSGDTDKQTVRGLRPLLEMPFLHLTPAGEQQMAEELSELKEKVSRDIPLSAGALEQFEKLTRNARFEGGHNRFHVSESQLERTALEISNLHAKGDKGRLLIPEFLGRQDPGSRKHRELPKDIPLLPVDDFISRYTDKGEGTLYHRTPKLENLLRVIRNGLVMSSSKQGTAVYGRGVYTTPDIKEASGYAGQEGIVIHLPVKKEVHPRILNLNDSAVKNSPSLQQIFKEADAQGRDRHEYLSKEYGIDIIVGTHVLVQNAAVLKTPKKTQGISRSLSFRS